MKIASLPKLATYSLPRDYAAAMREYVKKPGEAALQLAYELGRRALDEGTAMVEIAGFYHKALMAMLRSTRTQAECVEKAESCGSFFVESLSPFEMTYRGHREAQAAMRQLNEGMEAEAKRIAHALHDEAGQLLMGVHFALERLSGALPPGFEPPKWKNSYAVSLTNCGHRCSTSLDWCPPSSFWRKELPAGQGVTWSFKARLQNGSPLWLRLLYIGVFRRR
jgi:hypothetical protein